jgi:hypothetical protein
VTTLRAAHTHVVRDATSRRTGDVVVVVAAVDVIAARMPRVGGARARRSRAARRPPPGRGGAPTRPWIALYGVSRRR